MLPDWVPQEAWDGFVASRRAGKHPLTPRAVALLLSKLDDLRRQGYPPADVLNQSTMNGWRGLFPVKSDNGGSNGRFDPAQYIANTLAARVGVAPPRAADGDVWDAVPQPVPLGSSGE